MQDRRGRYFAFQGLLMAVLLLLLASDSGPAGPRPIRVLLIAGAMGASLAFVRLASESLLARWWSHTGLFLGDSGLAYLTLHWTRQSSDLYALYLLVIFGAALTRNLGQSMAVAALCTLLYGAEHWVPGRGLPASTEFWLQVHFLWVTTLVLAILSRDTQQAQQDQDRRYQSRLIGLESLATLGQLSAEVAHRIKGPLTTILVNSEVLSHRLADDKPALVELRQIQEEVEHCKGILKNLLDLGRIEELDLAPLDLRDPIREALRRVKPQLLKHGLRLNSSRLDAPLPAKGDASMLQAAFFALLQNAVESVAGRRGGEIWLSTETVREGRSWWRRSPAQRLVHLVSVRDNGVGLDAARLEVVFRPFFSTKPEGSGLGLPSALRILEKHGGTIEAASDGPAKGATFTLRLPAARRRR